MSGMFVSSQAETAAVGGHMIREEQTFLNSSDPPESLLLSLCSAPAAPGGAWSGPEVLSFEVPLKFQSSVSVLAAAGGRYQTVCSAEDISDKQLILIIGTLSQEVFGRQRS